MRKIILPAVMELSLIYYKHREYTDLRYASQNPCTTVYRLVSQLLGKDEELNKELIKKTESE